MSLPPFFQGSAKGAHGWPTEVEVRHLCFATHGLAQWSVPVPSSGPGGLATSGGARKYRLGEFGRRGGAFHLHPGGMMVVVFPSRDPWDGYKKADPWMVVVCFFFFMVNLVGKYSIHGSFRVLKHWERMHPYLERWSNRVRWAAPWVCWGFFFG